MGCRGSSRPPITISAPQAPDRIAIVAAESGPQGARLVAIDERGDRRFGVVAALDSDVLVRDTHPVISPDGKWLVFASSRGRRLDETSLWIAPLAADSPPTQLTTGDGLDSHPTWARDGRAIIFASTRAGGDFDLYRLALDHGRAGALTTLTSGAGHEITPTVASDGTVLYAAVTPQPDGQIESHLEARAPDGTISRVTEGPADTSPALTPDDRTIVFARPKEHMGSLDTELWTMPRGGAATQLIDLPMTDESGPVWSPDGRHLFATSVLRGAQGNAVFSSVIVIDTRRSPLTARLLEDRIGAVPRLTPAVTRTPLDADALASDPEYLPELARIMAAAIAAQKLETKSP